VGRKTRDDVSLRFDVRFSIHARVLSRHGDTHINRWREALRRARAADPCYANDEGYGRATRRETQVCRLRRRWQARSERLFVENWRRSHADNLPRALIRALLSVIMRCQLTSRSHPIPRSLKRKSPASLQGLRGSANEGLKLSARRTTFAFHS